MRFALFLVLGFVLVSPAAGRPLDFPVRDLAHLDASLPAWAGDVLSIRLTPRAAKALRPHGAPSAGRLGIASVDALAASLDAWIEPEFRGEAPPEPGSDAPDFTSFYIVHLRKAGVLSAALDRFEALPEVQTASPIGLTAAAAVPDDSLFDQCYWLYQSSRRDIHATEAWDQTTGDSSIVIAIIDTGVIPYHPDLGGTGGRGNIWTNEAEKAGKDGIDDDENGFVDDVWGWDFVTLDYESYVVAGEDWQDADNDPNDFVGHGTAVAGLAGAIGDNGIGIAGTAWTVKLMPLRMGYSAVIQPAGVVRMDWLAQGVRYAARMGASVINISSSTVSLTELTLAIREAVRSGITVVSAAGNNQSPAVVAMMPEVIAVAATDGDDIVQPWSNTGPWVDVSAPGAGLTSTIIQREGSDSLGLRQCAYAIGGVYGTSYAAPLVSGAAALLQARRKLLGLTPLAPGQILSQLQVTCDDISALQDPKVTGYGAGRINIERAMVAPVHTNVVPIWAQGVGAPVALPTERGRTRTYLATKAPDELFVMDDLGDVVRHESLSRPPVGGVSAADRRPGGRPIVFVACGSGMVAGFDETGAPLPGWPAQADNTQGEFVAVPALGDLDGDGAIEIVVLNAAGAIWAWHDNGDLLPSCPMRLSDRRGANAPPALAELDGAPGLEIVAVEVNGAVHVLRYDGTELPGFPFHPPQRALPAAPVVLSAPAGPRIVVADARDVRILGLDGFVRFTAQHSEVDRVVREPALADLDGDGRDDVLIAVETSLMAWNQDLEPLATPGWPLVGDQLLLGTPVVGQLAPGPGLEIAILGELGLLAFDDHAQPVPGFAPPGLAGLAPTLTVIADSSLTRIIAGTLNGLLYVHDALPGSYAPAPLGWLTPRGNFARTGSRSDAPPASTVDDEPPSTITDLRLDPAGTHSALARWTAPADSGPSGIASYEVRTARYRLNPSSFYSGRLVPGPPDPGEPGTEEAFVATGLVEGIRNFVAVRARDRAGTSGAISNVPEVVTPIIRPAAIGDLSGTVDAASQLVLRWTATGDDSLQGALARYEVGTLDRPFTPENFDSALTRWTLREKFGPGQPETLAVFFPPTDRIWVAVRAVDAGGFSSALSNQLGLDGRPPDRINDLAAYGITTRGAGLRWTAPRDGDSTARATAYRLLRFLQPGNPHEVPDTIAGLPSPGAPGTKDSVFVDHLPEGRLVRFSLQSRDSTGWWSDPNDIEVVLGTMPPAPVRDLGISRLTPIATVLGWTASGDDGDVGRPAAYDLRADVAPITEASFSAAPLQEIKLATQFAGGAETVSFTGLAPGGHWWVALRCVDSIGQASGISNLVEVDRHAPSAVADLAVESLEGTLVRLRWTATGGDGRAPGRPARYQVRAAAYRFDSGSFPGLPLAADIPATADAGAPESLTFRALRSAGHYWIAVRAVDAAGNSSSLSNLVEVQVVGSGPLAGREGIALASGAQPTRLPAYLHWQASHGAEAEHHTLTIYDVSGRRVRELSLEAAAGGVAPWDGRNQNGSRVPAGLYLARLASPRESARARIVLVP